MIDMFKINRLVNWYMEDYPEVIIHVSYDPLYDSVKWTFRAYSNTRWETCTHGCFAWDYSADDVLEKIRATFHEFMLKKEVQSILQQNRLEKI